MPMRDLSGFVEQVAPERWKVLQGMAVDGQNNSTRSEWEVNRDAFDQFVDCNSHRKIKPVVERESVMRGSYAMIAPDGRFFDSTQGFHSYSDSILEVGVENAWNQICFDPALF